MVRSARSARLEPWAAPSFEMGATRPPQDEGGGRYVFSNSFRFVRPRISAINGFNMRRTDLQAMAQAKLDDASILLSNKRYSNAYYLAGYSIELGLKACIARQISAETIPDKALIKRILDHQFGTLIGLAGLATALKEQQDKNPNFAANWAVVSEWSPDSRYEQTDAMSAQLIVNAIADPKSGVLQWIK